jgi:hypothetical protein
MITRPSLPALAAIALIAVLAAAPRAARADDPAASALFDEGKALFAAGKFREARDKLQASYELSPLSGTAGLLAACHERTGQLASAWTRYRDSAVLADRSGNPERAAIARAKAEELAPRLARLTIEAPAGGAAVSVTHNGARVPPAALSTEVPVDAGPHVVVASAPGLQSWTTTLEIADGERRSIAIPELAPLVAAAPPARGRPARAWIGLGLAGVGGAAILAGGGFGIAAAGDWSDARDAGCNDDGVCPDEESRDLASTAGSRADLATGLIAGGLVAAAAGLILFWTTPDRDGEREVAGRPAALDLSATVDGGRFTVALEGRF